ncbi:MAG: Serine/threonine protein kinase [Chloroflexi bacterium AL-W]|nr:Serine/threonine protein kinase [Chloroflexi bacterium AL-N1]NOK70523.1 Serine/threonine protein kinase [Chloroflexi bacterium AL-N10]NOK78118.1 Serine/threonine protein kinase [Chloroflexi bacterium AL-N5]NOK85217.1 Serine/threonine protein kinase [Chloroflexi bacterium AL-W]NOK91982.1 Serine/threonine protein kinase [Chloroflexi bacterium AL-N15]
MTTLIGQNLGRYHIDEEIGRGGMARVYRATDSLLQRSVALKVLAPQLAIDPEFAHRFDREAVTAANLRHANIVTIYDVGEQDGLRYIAMEYVRGRTLHAIIEDLGAIGLRYAVPITSAVAAALDYAHSHNAVHRDVKPQNVMIDVDGRVLLTDFGIAQAPSSDSGQRITKTGVFMGTPEYISPEQASAHRVDGRSDLYSLGIATYEMITGAVPFSGTTLQLIIAHAQQPPPPPSEIDSSLPAALDRVMMRILAKKPEDRFTSGMAFVDALKSIARYQGVALATNQQLAELTKTSTSSAGQSTVRMGQGPAVHSSPAPPAPPPAPSSVASPPPAPAYPATLPGNGHQGVPSSAPSVPSTTQRRQRIEQHTPPRPVARPSTQGGNSNGGARISWAIAAPLLGGLFFVLLFVLFRDTGQTNPFTNTPVPVNTLFPTLVTNTPTSTPTATSTVTPTAIPTADGTFTPIPSTTPVPIPTTTPRIDVFPFPTFTPTSPPPTEVPIEEPPGEEPTVEPPGAEPTAEPPLEEPTVEPPGEEPTAEPPGEEPTVEPPGAEPTAEPPLEEPTAEPPATSSETLNPTSTLLPEEVIATMTSSPEPAPETPVPNDDTLTPTVEVPASETTPTESTDTYISFD